MAYLLEKETITGGEMVAILQGRDPEQEPAGAAVPEEAAPAVEAAEPVQENAAPPLEIQRVEPEEPAEAEDSTF